MEELYTTLSRIYSDVYFSGHLCEERLGQMDDSVLMK